MTDKVNPQATATYSHEFVKSTGVSGFTGLYGWFFGPGGSWPAGSVEWYIVEDWGWNGAMGSQGTNKGSITVDGGTYTIYYAKKSQWDQWWSIRTSKRTSGTISYPKYYQAWRKAGMADKQVARIAFMMEPYWGGATGGSLLYSNFTISKPTEGGTVEVQNAPMTIDRSRLDIRTANGLTVGIPDSRSYVLQVFGLDGRLIERRTAAGPGIVAFPHLHRGASYIVRAASLESGNAGGQSYYVNLSANVLRECK
jgi:hypothetical protein